MIMQNFLDWNCQIILLDFWKKKNSKFKICETNSEVTLERIEVIQTFVFSVVIVIINTTSEWTYYTAASFHYILVR